MKIDDLSLEERERIQEICQKLFHENYITQYIFAANDKLSKSNMDYNFILSHYSAIEELLACTGWRLCHDKTAGVIFIATDYPGAKVTLSKIETYLLFAMRLIYDTKKTTASSTGQVYVTIREVEEELVTLNSIKITSKNDRKKAFTTLYNKNIIERFGGDLSELDTRIAIMPSIVSVISSSRVEKALEMLGKKKEAKDNDIV